MPADAKTIRERCFSTAVPYDTRLAGLCAGERSHAFLANPASQNTYLYLVEYIRRFSEVRLEKPLQELRLLDWGCGKGHVTHLLRKRGAIVTSCDVDDASDDSSFGQRTPIVNGDGIRVVPLRHEFLLPFTDESFDAVVSMGVLEHVPRERESVRELHRVLRPGGLFFCFYLPQTLSWTQLVSRLRGDHYHDRLYTKRKIRRLLRDADFAPIDIWRRALFPKNTVAYRDYRRAEAWDQRLCALGPLGYFATNIEFVAAKGPPPAA